MIFIYRHDTGISPQQLQKLRREGYIPVGVKNLGDVKIVEAPIMPEASLILLACARAMKRHGGSATQYLGEEIAKAIIAQSEPSEEPK